MLDAKVTHCPRVVFARQATPRVGEVTWDVKMVALGGQRVPAGRRSRTGIRSRSWACCYGSDVLVVDVVETANELFRPA